MHICRADTLAASFESALPNTDMSQGSRLYATPALQPQALHPDLELYPYTLPCTLTLCPDPMPRTF